MIGIVKLQQVIQSIINGHNGSLQNYMIKDWLILMKFQLTGVQN